MKKNNVYACLLAGGKGTRLWPLSNESCSKSFIRIGKRKPLIVETIVRLRGLIAKKNIVVVVDKAQAKLVKGVPRRNILVEPFGRSTASAIGLAAISLKPEDIMVVLPTDALIKDPGAFKKSIKRAIDFTSGKDGSLLCLGIKPWEATSAYGYIKVKDTQNRGIFSVDRFIEKPTEKIAASLIKKKNFLWNAGIFVFRAKDILEAMRKYAPLLHKELECIKKRRYSKKRAYARMKNVSIDYQIMEKAKNLHCVKANFLWRDLGNWRALTKLLKKDKFGNATFGKVKLVRTRNSIAYNTRNTKLGLVGLKDTVVVNTKNGILVSSKKDAEKVKELA